MTLRNAFGNLMLDATGVALGAAITAVQVSVDAVTAAVNGVKSSVDGVKTSTDKISQETTQQAISANIAELAHDAFAGQRPGGWLPYSKNVADDSMRVTMQGGLVSTQGVWGSNNAQATWYSTGSPNSVDARDMATLASQQLFQQTRLGRWQIT